MNDIWETGDLPSIWKLANAIIIPKPDKYHSHPSNNRPITLTSCVCKTMEEMINARLVRSRQVRSILDHPIRFEMFIRNAFA